MKTIAQTELFRLFVESYDDHEDCKIENPIITRWSYTVQFYFDVHRMLYEDNFLTEAEAIAAGKTAIVIACQGHIDDLNKTLSQYQEVKRLCLSPLSRSEDV